MIRRVTVPAAAIGGFLLAVASGASAAGWTAPAVIARGPGAAPIARPVVRATSNGVVVAAWERGREVRFAARYVGGPWTAPRAIAVAGGAGAPRFVSQGATAALAVVAGPDARVRVARWSRGLIPTVNGPPGSGGARDVRLSVLPSGEMVALFRHRGAVAWSARPPSGGWSRTAPLFAGGTSPALASDANRAVLATALRPTSAGTRVGAALRSAGETFGPTSTIRPLGPRWTITSATPAIRPDGRTGLVIAARGPSGRGALLATVAGARQRPVRVSAAGVRLAGPPAVVVRPVGGLVAAWRQVDRGGVRLHAAQEADAGGESWEAPVALTPPRRVGAPALENASGGRVILAVAMDGAIYVRTLAPAGGATGWSAARRVSGANRRCAAPSITFDAADRAIVAFSCDGGRTLLMVSER